MLTTRIGCAVWIVAIGIASQANSQTLDLRAVQVSILNGAECERFLAAHNIARQKVGVGPVQSSDELSSYALESLAQQKDALIDQAKAGWSKESAVLPKHRTESTFGENVAGRVGGSSASAEFAVAFWLREKAAFEKLNEIARYRVGDEKDKVETDAMGKERPIIVGHYTAIVWRTTRFIGAAKLSFDLIDDQANSQNYVAIVCNYSPPGNQLGETPY